MNWTKIPTDLLQSRTPDRELISIIKYQLLWATLERQPDDEIALRYMTPKQLSIALQYLPSIKQQLSNDIKYVENHRNCQKNYYEKKQTLSDKTDNQSDNQHDSQAERADKIRLDNNTPYNPPKGDKKFSEEFESFWKEFPKQRAGSKDKAYTSFCRVLKEKRATIELLLKSVKQYALSDEVKKGFAKGCAAWLNDDRFNVQYQHENKYGNWDNF